MLETGLIHGIWGNKETIGELVWTKCMHVMKHEPGDHSETTKWTRKGSRCCNIPGRQDSLLGQNSHCML